MKIDILSASYKYKLVSKRDGCVMFLSYHLPSIPHLRSGSWGIYASYVMFSSGNFQDESSFYIHQYTRIHSLWRLKNRGSEVMQAARSRVESESRQESKEKAGTSTWNQMWGSHPQGQSLATLWGRLCEVKQGPNSMYWCQAGATEEI